MKKLVLLFLAGGAVLLSLLGACKSAGEGPPERVLQSFIDQLVHKNIDGAAKLATPESKPALEIIKRGMELAAAKEGALSQDTLLKEFENVEYGKPKITDDLAYITVRNKQNDKASADFILIKKDGKWKVDFSMAALLKMAQRQWQQHIPDNLDSLSPVDKEGLQHSFEMADSVLKNMDPKQLEEIQQHLEKLKTE